MSSPDIDSTRGTGPGGTGDVSGGPGPVPTPRGAHEDRSLGEIVGDITTDLSALLRQEVELAKTEMKQEMTRAGKGAGMLGGAGLTGYLFLFFGSLTLVYLLDTWMHQALAALIVTALWGGAAGLLALTGRNQLRASNPELPRTQQTLKEDAAWARAQKS